MIELLLQDYKITIGDHRLPFRAFLSEKNYSKVAVLVDENTKRHCLPMVLEGLDFTMPPIGIPAGERYKTLDTCKAVWDSMLGLSLDRRSLLVCLGGGVVGDLGGFCAAVYQRGIDFVQMPTTLLAMADASIGGKVGVDYLSMKNMIGAFCDPAAVFIHPVFLKTLPAAELTSGFAEVFKHALIADAALWERLEQLDNLNSADWATLLPLSLSVKQHIVAADPLENGIRKMLNFGHTVGHAVESFALMSERPLLHGEAVALGILCESWLSWKILGLPTDSLERIAHFVRRFYEPFPIRRDDFPQLLALMKKDKKNERGRINFTLLPAIGQAVVDQYCEAETIMESLAWAQS